MSIEAIGLDKAISLLTGLPKQIRYATAQALNDTAKDVQTFTTQHLLPEKFTLRGRGRRWFEPGQRFGFNVQFANKDQLVSVIGSRADWLALQEHGGTKQVSGHRLAIPRPFWKAKEDIIRHDKKPRQILIAKLRADLQRATANVAARRQSGAKGELLAAQREARKIKRSLAAHAGAEPAFEAKMKSGRTGIFVRDQAKHIHLLFSYETSAHVKARLQFEQQGQQVVERTYQAHFTHRLAIAIATAK